MLSNITSASTRAFQLFNKDFLHLHRHLLQHRYPLPQILVLFLQDLRLLFHIYKPGLSRLSGTLRSHVVLFSPFHVLGSSDLYVRSETRPTKRIIFSVIVDILRYISLGVPIYYPPKDVIAHLHFLFQRRVIVIIQWLARHRSIECTFLRRFNYYNIFVYYPT